MMSAFLWVQVGIWMLSAAWLMARGGDVAAGIFAIGMGGWAFWLALQQP
jgi:hypothetical protein